MNDKKVAAKVMNHCQISFELPVFVYSSIILIKTSEDTT